MTKAHEYGKVVKTFKRDIPMPDLSYENEATNVRFQPSDGYFTIEWPKHIGAVIAEIADADDANIGYSKRTYAKTLDEVMENFSRGVELYKRWVQDQTKEKFLSITFKYNVARSGSDGTSFTEMRAREIMHIGEPALHLRYEIVYKIGEAYFREFNDRLESIGHSTGERILLPWTQDRETFLDNTTGALRILIGRLVEFFSDAEGNIDHMIASRQTFLPGPKIGEDRFNYCQNERGDYWNNQTGWTDDIALATGFTDSEVTQLDLPVEGEWVRITKQERQNENG